MALTDKLTAIADAIRAKTGGSALMTLDDMPDEIASISGGGGDGFDWSLLLRIYFKNPSTQTALDFNDIEIDASGMNTISFNNCSNITAITFPNSFDTSALMTTDSMFASCTSLTSLDLTMLDTANVISMASMFNGDRTALTSVNMHGLNTANVTNMNAMFYQCNTLASVDMSGFDTTRVTNMLNMFYYCSSLVSLDLSSFDTRAVKNMGSMFYGCSRLKSVNLWNWDTSSVTNMSSMFLSTALEAVIWSQKPTVQKLVTSPTSSWCPTSAIFYVPDDLVDDYQAATNWSTIASRIKGISELPATYKTLYGIQ